VRAALLNTAETAICLKRAATTRGSTNCDYFCHAGFIRKNGNAQHRYTPMAMDLMAFLPSSGFSSV
jgi:hypothetical protein